MAKYTKEELACMLGLSRRSNYETEETEQNTDVPL